MQDERFLLFCFPYAGGTSDFYNDIEEACGDRVEFVKLDYAGHGKRMKEKLCQSIGELTEDLLPQVKKRLKANPGMSYAMMGYSMGSIVMFDMLIRIAAISDCRLPWGVFISAHEPQPIESLKHIPEENTDDWVKERTIEFGGIDKRLLNNSSFWRIYLPIFKADYKMIADYRFADISFTTNVPATVFYSEEDTPLREMQEWKRYFVGDCDFVSYNGSHFFIENNYQDMADIIVRKHQSFNDPAPDSGDINE